MKGLNPGARAILEAGRDAHRPSPADRDRVRVALLAQLAVAASVTTLAAPAAAAGASTAAGHAAGASLGVASILTTTAGKVVACVALVAAVGGGAALGIARVHDPEPSRVEQRRAVESSLKPGHGLDRAPRGVLPTPVLEGAPVDVAPIAVPDDRSSATTSARPAPSRPGPVASPMTVELQLLRSAHAALRTGDATRAMELIEEGTSRFPDGQLAQERAASRVVALCALGRSDDARAAAREFLRAWPASPHAARIRSACPDQGVSP